MLECQIIREGNPLVDSLKIIAMVTMLIDHIGYVFFPEMLIFRIIGRLSFPLFAWGVAAGYQRTRSLEKYMVRLFLVGIASQLPYMHLFQVTNLNILFTLLWGVVAIFIWQRVSPLLALLLSIPAEGLVSYGFYGIIVILLFHVFQEDSEGQFVALLIATLIYSSFKLASIQLFAIFTIPLIKRISHKPVSFPRYFAYFFYPVHLILLGIIRTVI